MKICFVYEYYYPHMGGGETLVQQLAEGLASRGHDVCVITSQLPGTDREQTLNGVRISRVPVPRFGDRYWFTILGIRRIMKAAAEADIIQAATYNGAITAWLAAKIKKKPVVLFPFEVLRGLWHKIGLNPAAAMTYRIFEEAILALPYDSYSCISESTRSVLLKSRISPEKAFVAYPGIDYELFDPDKAGNRDEIRASLGIDENTFLYMYTGRPGVVKGVEHLLAAVPEISRRIPHSRLLLLLSSTPPPKYREAMKLVSALGRDVILMEPVPRQQLPRYFHASDCVIVPSLNEGFGFTCAEACAMGKPVVATTAGSLPEVISGKFVSIPPQDSGAIADAVERVFAGDYETSELKRFEWEDAVEKHIETFHRLLSRA